MRYARMQANKEMPAKTTGRGGVVFVIVMVVLAAAIYLIGAAKVGDFLAQHVWAPVAALFGDEPESSQDGQVSGEALQTGAEGSTAGEEGFTWQMAESTVYALQAGAYDEAQNAETFAKSLQQKGGAGYVHYDGEVYRVLIAAYGSETDAKSVIERLQAEQQMETRLYLIQRAAISLPLSADARTRETLTAAGQAAAAYTPQLMSLAISYDKGEISETQAVARLKEWAEEAQGQQQAMEALQAAGLTAQPVEALQVYYAALAEGLQTAAAAEGQAAVSAAIKQCYLRDAFAAKGLAEGLQAQ